MLRVGKLSRIDELVDVPGDTTKNLGELRLPARHDRSGCSVADALGELVEVGRLDHCTVNGAHDQFGRHPTRLACQAAALVELEQVVGKAICSL